MAMDNSVIGGGRLCLLFFCMRGVGSVFGCMMFSLDGVYV